PRSPASGPRATPIGAAGPPCAGRPRRRSRSRAPGTAPRGRWRKRAVLGPSVPSRGRTAGLRAAARAVGEPDRDGRAVRRARQVTRPERRTAAYAAYAAYV